MEEAYVVFTLNDQLYGLPSNQIREVLRLKEIKINKLPLVSDLIMGMINLRGSIFPVVNGAALFNLGQAAEGEFSRIIVVSYESALYGILVGKVMGARTLVAEESHEEPIKMIHLKDYLRW